jgi:hypothetical protein
MSNPIGIGEAITQMRSADASMETRWTDLVNEWSPESPPPIVSFAEFARVAYQTLDQPGGATSAVFALIETFLTGDSDDEVKEAVKTGFLEALANMPEAATSRNWVDRLGPESRTYMEQWDVFWHS